MKQIKQKLIALLAAVICGMIALSADTAPVYAAGNDLAVAQSQGVLYLTQEWLDLVASLETWQGEALTKNKGVLQGPSGKESWYNMDMTPVLNCLAQNNIFGEYWVREDGCKMYGPFIIVAANYELHPIGTLVETSLGIGIVGDTGGFCISDPTMVDIATVW